MDKKMVKYKIIGEKSCKGIILINKYKSEYYL